MAFQGADDWIRLIRRRLIRLERISAKCINATIAHTFSPTLEFNRDFLVHKLDNHIRNSINQDLQN